jgi:hypothetical protein
MREAFGECLREEYILGRPRAAAFLEQATHGVVALAAIRPRSHRHDAPHQWRDGRWQRISRIRARWGVNAFLDRPLYGHWPYPRLDASYLKVRYNGRVVSVAAIIAVAVSTEGRREIIGLGIGALGGRAVLVDFPRGPGQAWIA